MEMHPIMQGLVAFSFLSVIGICGYLAFSIKKIVPPPPGILGALQTISLTGLGIAAGITIFLVSADWIYSYWQATQNKQKF
jgi:hypothetical protein